LRDVAREEEENSRRRTPVNRKKAQEEFFFFFKKARSDSLERSFSANSLPLAPLTSCRPLAALKKKRDVFIYVR
jgi:hypothetical protein